MKKKVIPIITIFLILSLSITIGILQKNPRVKLLLSVVHFTEETLSDPTYLLYDIDIMEFIHDYLNADTKITGKAQMYNIEGLGFSVSADVEGLRSLPTRQAALTSGLSVIGKSVGDMEVYAEDQTVYLVVPMLDNLAYAFPTGIDLFMRMPDLTSDLNQKWFRDHAKDIIEFTGEIGIEKTDSTIKSANGRISQEYIITIPEGSGDFIWDLFGMDYPDYDVVVSLYLTDQNRFRRIEMDLSEVLPGAYLIIDGENANTCMIDYELPDDEQVYLTVSRDGEHKNKLLFEATYFTNTSQKYHLSGDLYWSLPEDGIEIKCKDVTVKRGNKTLATAYFSGSILPLENEPDVLSDAPVDLYQLEKLDWKAIRDDVDGFMSDMKEKLAESQSQ